jgi:hypothetical protein
MDCDMNHDIIDSDQSSIRPAAAFSCPRCASLRRFLVSTAQILLSLRHSLLILSASAIDTTRGRAADES